jgi:hypothetical protein
MIQRIRLVIACISCLLITTQQHAMQFKTFEQSKKFFELKGLYLDLKSHSKVFKECNLSVPRETSDRWRANQTTYARILDALLKNNYSRNHYLVTLVKELSTIPTTFTGKKNCPRQLVQDFEELLGQYIAKLEKEVNS